MELTQNFRKMTQPNPQEKKKKLTVEDIRKSEWYKNLSEEDQDNWEAANQDAYENSLEYHLKWHGR